VRKAEEAEFAILNGGGIRGNRLYSAGAKITKCDVLDELPFGNKTIVTNVPGSAVLSALENGFSRIGTPAGRFPQISGVAVVVDPGGELRARVKTITVNGEALDPGRVYRIATNDFMARGGDGYGMLVGKSDVTKDSGTRLVAVDVISYAQALRRIDAKVEGRIVFR
jgi:5'-nucleotidase / UDP-sugar diphosphatase